MAATMGKDGFISIDGTTGKPVYIDSWTLTPGINTAEVTAYGDSFKAYVSTIKEWSATCAGTLDRSDTTGQAVLLAKFESTAASTSINLWLYDSTSHWQGTALVTGETINSSVSDKVSVSWTFQGTGALSYVTT
jgi:hypothetical protein